MTFARPSLTARSLFVALALALAAGGLVFATPALARHPVPPVASYGPTIEPLADYQPQTTCSPRAKPGVVSYANLLERTWPRTGSLGISRPCNVGGTSEHKEGRAFDWAVSAGSAADRRRVANLMAWLLATDRHGNEHAMVRRLGIQYMIWNRRSWRAYDAGSGWQAYTGSSPHTDHVHFSFSWRGARKNTSFWAASRSHRIGVAAAQR